MNAPLRSISYLRDTLVNFISGLGTLKDPARISNYSLTLLDRNQLENAYRSDWIARRIVDAPAEDQTREWRDWQAAQDQIEKIENLEKLHDLQRKLKLALIRARLYGGAALVMGVEDGKDPKEPLNLDGVKANGLEFVVVMNRYELNAGPRIYNVQSPWYTRPEWYSVSTPLFGWNNEKGEAYPEGGPDLVERRPAQGQSPAEIVDPPQIEGDVARQMTPYAGMVMIHPSRVIEFAGNELPDWRLAPMGGGWGDSVLQTADDTLRSWGMSLGGIASMVNDAKMDVIKIKDFAKNIATAEYAARLQTRFATANASKSTINSIVLDKEEEWNRIQSNFSSLPQLLQQLLTIVAGAGGIPVSRLVGSAPGRGLAGAGHSGGESDLRNYYDSISATQKTVLRPILDPLDQVIIRSAIGKGDPNIHYTWAPLYLPDPKDDATVKKTKAETTQIYVNSGLINEDALREAALNQLIEDSVYPGLEDAIEEYGGVPEVPEARQWSPGLDPVTGKPVAAAGGAAGARPAAPPIAANDRRFEDATPRTLYVRRDVLNGEAIRHWFRQQGFKSLLDENELHVTIIFSKAPVDWMKVGESSPAYQPPGSAGQEQGWLTIPDGGPRLLERFGDAIVLCFASSALSWRHEMAKYAGATWDYEDYNPHITLTYRGDDIDLTKVEPYRGPIELGPEIFEEVREGWKEGVTEDAAE